MILRNKLSEEKKLAHKVLDLVRAGLDVADEDIRCALVVLGDVE